MKVVLFCGGMGTRLREYSDITPKPLVNIGAKPIIWHLMRYYAHFGHTEFILCLGYKGEMIREFFLSYEPKLSEDFVMERGVSRLVDEQSDVGDWSIHFVDTGLHSNIGERLVAVRHLVQDDEYFIASYTDQLCDLNFEAYSTRAVQSGAIASFVAVKPYGSFHSVDADDTGFVREIIPVSKADNWINGGYMVLHRDVFDYITPGEELVEEPFNRLIEKRALYCHKHEGFWQAMDTYKDKLAFDKHAQIGDRPWEVWRRCHDRI